MIGNELFAMRILLLGREVIDHGTSITQSEDWLRKYIFKYKAVPVTGVQKLNEPLEPLINVIAASATIYHVIRETHKQY
jgi:hypothetical protein